MGVLRLAISIFVAIHASAIFAEDHVIVVLEVLENGSWAPVRDLKIRVYQPESGGSPPFPPVDEGRTNGNGAFRTPMISNFGDKLHVVLGEGDPNSHKMRQSAIWHGYPDKEIVVRAAKSVERVVEATTSGGAGTTANRILSVTRYRVVSPTERISAVRTQPIVACKPVCSEPVTAWRPVVSAPTVYSEPVTACRPVVSAPVVCSEPVTAWQPITPALSTPCQTAPWQPLSPYAPTSLTYSLPAF